MAIPRQRQQRGYNQGVPSQRQIDARTRYAQPQFNQGANPAAAQVRAGWGWGASPDTASAEIKAGWAQKQPATPPGQKPANVTQLSQPGQAGGKTPSNPSDVMQAYREGRMSAQDASNALQVISKNAGSFASAAMNAQVQRAAQASSQGAQAMPQAQQGTATPAPQNGPVNPYTRGGNAPERWNDMQTHTNGYEGHPGMMNGYSVGQVTSQPSQQSQPMRVNNPSYMSITPAQNGGTSLNSTYGTGSVHGGAATGGTYIGDKTGDRTGQFAGPSPRAGGQ